MHLAVSLTPDLYLKYLIETQSPFSWSNHQAVPAAQSYIIRHSDVFVDNSVLAALH